MFADSKYTFSRKTILKTSYILEEKQGRDFPFPVYKNIPHCKAAKESLPELKGKTYCTLGKPNSGYDLYLLEYEYSLGVFGYRKPAIGINPQHLPDGTHRAFGYNKNNNFLVEFSKDWNTMTIYIFDNKNNDAEKQFAKWNNGEEIKVLA